METETRRALELESAVRPGAGLYPRCCADQKEEKGMEADTNTELKSIRKRRWAKGYKNYSTASPNTAEPEPETTNKAVTS
jgi:hypothetical protein